MRRFVLHSPTQKVSEQLSAGEVQPFHRLGRLNRRAAPPPSQLRPRRHPLQRELGRHAGRRSGEALRHVQSRCARPLGDVARGGRGVASEHNRSALRAYRHSGSAARAPFTRAESCRRRRHGTRARCVLADGRHTGLGSEHARHIHRHAAPWYRFGLTDIRGSWLP